MCVNHYLIIMSYYVKKILTGLQGLTVGFILRILCLALHPERDMKPTVRL